MNDDKGLNNKIEIIFDDDEGLKLVVHLEDEENNKFEIKLKSPVVLKHGNDVKVVKGSFTLNDIVQGSMKFKQQYIDKLLFGYLN